MKEQIDKLNRLSESHGSLQPGKGLVSGVIALCLAALCFLGVLAFHFPQYLTTPELRHAYNVDAMRLLLFCSLVLSGAMALFEGIDRNYAAHFAFLDYAFGTAHNADRPWPDRYGVVGDYVPNGFFRQLAFPFLWKR
jgi:hypothetical protein